MKPVKRLLALSLTLILILPPTLCFARTDAKGMSWPEDRIFPVFSDELIHQLEDKYSCSYWDWGRTDPQHSITRIVTSWATDPKSVDAFLNDLKQLTK